MICDLFISFRLVRVRQCLNFMVAFAASFGCFSVLAAGKSDENFHSEVVIAQKGVPNNSMCIYPGDSDKAIRQLLRVRHEAILMIQRTSEFNQCNISTSQAAGMLNRLDANVDTVIKASSGTLPSNIFQSFCMNYIASYRLASSGCPFAK